MLPNYGKRNYPTTSDDAIMTSENEAQDALQLSPALLEMTSDNHEQIPSGSDLLATGGWREMESKSSDAVDLPRNNRSGDTQQHRVAGRDYETDPLFGHATGSFARPLPAPKTPAAFFEQARRRLQRAKTGDILKHKLQKRPERIQLVQQNILQDTNIDRSLQSTHRQLKRAKIADFLNDKISHRPGPLELIKKRILPSNDAFIAAVEDGSIHFKETSEGEANKHPQQIFLLQGDHALPVDSVDSALASCATSLSGGSGGALKRLSRSYSTSEADEDGRNYAESTSSAVEEIITDDDDIVEVDAETRILATTEPISSPQSASDSNAGHSPKLAKSAASTTTSRRKSLTQNPNAVKSPLPKAFSSRKNSFTYVAATGSPKSTSRPLIPIAPKPMPPSSSSSISPRHSLYSIASCRNGSITKKNLSSTYSSPPAGSGYGNNHIPNRHRAGPTPLLKPAHTIKPVSSNNNSPPAKTAPLLTADSKDTNAVPAVPPPPPVPPLLVAPPARQRQIKFHEYRGPPGAVAAAAAAAAAAAVASSNASNSQPIASKRKESSERTSRSGQSSTASSRSSSLAFGSAAREAAAGLTGNESSYEILLKQQQLYLQWELELRNAAALQQQQLKNHHAALMAAAVAVAANLSPSSSFTENPALIGENSAAPPAPPPPPPPLPSAAAIRRLAALNKSKFSTSNNNSSPGVAAAVRLLAMKPLTPVGSKSSPPAQQLGSVAEEGPPQSKSPTSNAATPMRKGDVVAVVSSPAPLATDLGDSNVFSPPSGTTTAPAEQQAKFDAASLAVVTKKLEELRVSTLKAELKKRSLPVSGPKPALIGRLLKCFANFDEALQIIRDVKMRAASDAAVAAAVVAPKMPRKNSVDKHDELRRNSMSSVESKSGGGGLSSNLSSSSGVDDNNAPGSHSRMQQRTHSNSSRAFSPFRSQQQSMLGTTTNSSMFLSPSPASAVGPYSSSMLTASPLSTFSNCKTPMQTPSVGGATVDRPIRVSSGSVSASLDSAAIELLLKQQQRQLQQVTDGVSANGEGGAAAAVVAEEAIKQYQHQIAELQKAIHGIQCQINQCNASPPNVTTSVTADDEELGSDLDDDDDEDEDDDDDDDDAVEGTQFDDSFDSSGARDGIMPALDNENDSDNDDDAEQEIDPEIAAALLNSGAVLLSNDDDEEGEEDDDEEEEDADNSVDFNGSQKSFISNPQLSNAPNEVRHGAVDCKLLLQNHLREKSLRNAAAAASAVSTSDNPHDTNGLSPAKITSTPSGIMTETASAEFKKKPKKKATKKPAVAAGAAKSKKKSNKVAVFTSTTSSAVTGCAPAVTSNQPVSTVPKQSIPSVAMPSVQSSASMPQPMMNSSNFVMGQQPMPFVIGGTPSAASGSGVQVAGTTAIPLYITTPYGTKGPVMAVTRGNTIPRGTMQVTMRGPDGVPFIALASTVPPPHLAQQHQQQFGSGPVPMNAVPLNRMPVGFAPVPQQQPSFVQQQPQRMTTIMMSPQQTQFAGGRSDMVMPQQQQFIACNGIGNGFVRQQWMPVVTSAAAGMKPTPGSMWMPQMPPVMQNSTVMQASPTSMFPQQQHAIPVPNTGGGVMAHQQRVPVMMMMTSSAPLQLAPTMNINRLPIPYQPLTSLQQQQQQQQPVKHFWTPSPQQMAAAAGPLSYPTQHNTNNSVRSTNQSQQMMPQQSQPTPVSLPSGGVTMARNNSQGPSNSASLQQQQQPVHYQNDIGASQQQHHQRQPTALISFSASNNNNNVTTMTSTLPTTTCSSTALDWPNFQSLAPAGNDSDEQRQLAFCNTSGDNVIQDAILDDLLDILKDDCLFDISKTDGGSGGSEQQQQLSEPTNVNQNSFAEQQGICRPHHNSGSISDSNNNSNGLLFADEPMDVCIASGGGTHSNNDNNENRNNNNIVSNPNTINADDDDEDFDIFWNNLLTATAQTAADDAAAAAAAAESSRVSNYSDNMALSTNDITFSSCYGANNGLLNAGANQTDNAQITYRGPEDYSSNQSNVASQQRNSNHQTSFYPLQYGMRPVPAPFCVQNG